MKFYLLLLPATFLFTLQQTALTQNPGDNIFAGIQVHTINIRFLQPNYWDSLTIYYYQGDEQYIPATVIVNGETYDSVGVRFKGQSSFTHPNNKKSFRLSFDEFRSGQRWDGLKGVHVNNCWEDPTLMREKIHLDFCRDAGVAAPRANFTRLLINDTLFAFYSLVEHVDKRFLSSRYIDNTGDLFKAVDGFGTGDTVLSDFRWLGNDTTLYLNRYELKTEESTSGWRKLVAVIDTLNNSITTVSSLPTKVNLNALYKAYATDILFGNLDSYIGTSRNFYSYFHPVTGKLEWIVWDTGLSFGAYPGSGVSNIENLSVTYVRNPIMRPMFGKVLNTPELKYNYLLTICNIHKGFFSQARLFPHIDNIANAIRAYVYEDQRKMFTNQQFETNIVSDITVSSGRKPGLKSFITLRQANVQNQLTNLGVNCNFSVNPGDIVINEFMTQNDSIPDPAGEFDDWIELYNNTTNTINLSGLYLTDDDANPTKWQFPTNTLITPNGFLIVWADENIGQIGLHANFQLSTSGGYIRLSNTDVSILDSISYNLQAANRSMARVPNGTGPFVQGRPTFNAHNGNFIIPDPIMTTIILPQVIQGINGTNSNRIPFAYRSKITGLLANTTYRYLNQIVTSADAATVNGAGNCIYVQSTGDFIRTSSPSLATTGNYGTFTTDATGSFEGWFVTEPTGNARFVPGKYIFMRISINNGSSGTTVEYRVTSNDSIRIVKLTTALSDSTGTGLRCTSSADPKDFVFAYDNTMGAGRPISGSFIESDGSPNTISNNYASFYANSVNGIDGAFGIVLPNALPNGIRRFHRYSLTDGALIATATDGDGIWPSGAWTINPSGGITEIVLTGDDVSLATDISLEKELPSSFLLSQNYPNPFNPMTTISFSLPTEQFVKLEVTNLIGQHIATIINERRPAGVYSLNFDASSLSSGIYFYKFTGGTFVQIKRMTFIK